MNADSLKTLQQLHIDFDSLPDNGVQDKIMLLINIVEQLAQENQELNPTLRELLLRSAQLADFSLAVKIFFM
ncbi:MAG: hypothetical protein QTN59_14315 [Candidatus Electrothrix communis]|nr:MAG: hypothetical protein QTN59_14315 [Candidatus Electrothrix communis]